MGRHRTPEEKAAFKVQATEMRLAGIGRKRIAARLHISQELVAELLADVPAPSSLLRLNAKDDHRDAAIALRLEGRTYREIQEELGVSKGSLSLWLRSLPLPTEELRLALHGRIDRPSDSLLLDDRAIARALRREGWLLREIAEELSTSVNSAFHWCEGLPVPPRAAHGGSDAEIAEAGRAYWAAKRPVMERERLDAIDAAAATVPGVDMQLLGLLAAVAYWCEGTKSKPWRRSEKLTLINSDPDVIRLWCAWLTSVGVTSDRVRLRLNIHTSGDVTGSTSFWAAVVGRDPSDFSKPTLKRHNPVTVRKNTGDGYYGCLTVSVLQSRDLYRQIEGTWRGLIKQVGQC